MRLGDVVKESLRTRSNRVIVEEVGAEECLDLLIALSAGLPGDICTIRATTSAKRWWPTRSTGAGAAVLHSPYRVLSGDRYPARFERESARSPCWSAGPLVVRGVGRVPHMRAHGQVSQACSRLDFRSSTHVAGRRSRRHQRPRLLGRSRR